MTSSESGKAEAQISSAHDRRVELLELTGWSLLGLGALVAAVAFLIFIIQHSGGMTGTMLDVLYWATIGLGVGSGSLFIVNQIYVRFIKTGSPVMPGLIAASTGALAGSANDIVNTTTEKVCLAVVLSTVGFFASTVYTKNKLVAILLIVAVPLVFLIVFLTKSPEWRQSWLHMQGMNGLFWMIFTMAMIAVSIVIASILDKVGE